jgi:hypothetical protein
MTAARALQWSSSMVDLASDLAPKMLHSKEVTTMALTDIEQEMVEVRMNSSSANLAATRGEKKMKASDVRCIVSVRALALGNYSRILAAAQKPSPEGYIEDNYGLLFPTKALEMSDVAAKRWIDSADYDRTRPPPGLLSDPLAPPDGFVPESETGGKQGRAGKGNDKEEAMRQGKKTGFSNSVVTSVVDYANRTKGGWTGRKRVTDDDVEDEHRAMASSGQPQARPLSRPQSRPTPALAASASVSAEEEAPAQKPAMVAHDGDPLGDPLGGHRRGSALGFGTDPLAAARQSMSSSASAPNIQSNGVREDEEDYDEADEEGGPLQQSSMSQQRLPLRGPPRRAPPTAPPGRAAPPPRRAPPGPGGAYGGGLRPAPPPASRPAPLRAVPTPGRPAPLAPARPAPGRQPPSKPDQLPL